MGETTGISWCDHTFNPWIGCTKVGPGCDHCYAEAQDARFSPDQSHWGVGAPRRVTSPTYWRQPDKWNQKAREDGVRRRVFCASQADVFDKEAPAHARANLWPVIERCNSLDWLIVTKRIPNVCDMTPWWWRMSEDAWPLHVWLIITVCNQVEAARDIPRLIDPSNGSESASSA
jgi:protein gp37